MGGWTTQCRGTKNDHESDFELEDTLPDSTWAEEAAPANFYSRKVRGVSDPYPYHVVRVEVRDEDFNLLSVHWSVSAALGEVGERMARKEKAAVYLARWERIESDEDPRLNETS
ncbi:hypothetical protein EKI51_08415 [Corynebacterium sanguinis]|uniref:hypothetical protein n=1 Tax=Corynebacterium sanguinis TaxID=2594913 RepID=UPI00119FE8EF|nr:hypothetical protein [Corynebacterium sanguinis]TVS23113.1 hypothetical protein EKI51_08415 [Corynebacterium sanguinis]